MASNYNARSVGIKLEIGQVTVPINSVTLRHTVDELPSAEVGIQLDNGSVGSVEMNTEMFRKMSQLLQEKIMNEFKTKPDVRLTVDDGNASKLVFDGFLCRPSVDVTYGTVLNKVGIVHAKAALQAWNGQIYNYVEPYVSSTFAEAFADGSHPDAKQAKTSKSVAMKVWAMVDLAHRTSYLQENLTDGAFDLLPIQMMNDSVKSIIHEVLKASETRTEIEGLEDDNFSSDNLLSSIFETLRNSMNFWGVMKYLTQMFLLQINADWRGNLWLEHLQTVEEPEDREISVPLNQIYFSSAHTYEIPLLQVIVMSRGSGLYINNGGSGLNQGDEFSPPVPTAAGEVVRRLTAAGETWLNTQVLARFPDSVELTEAGTFYLLDAPSWLDADAHYDSDFKDLLNKVPDKASYAEKILVVIENKRNALVKHNSPRGKILSHLARQLFQLLYLGATSAHLTVPLDLRICCGRTYTVKDMAGNALFIGYLQTVEHTITLGSGDVATAVTRLAFTHIRIAGADLKQLRTRLEAPMPVVIGSKPPDPTYKTPESVPPPVSAPEPIKFEFNILPVIDSQSIKNKVNQATAPETSPTRNGPPVASPKEPVTLPDKVKPVEMPKKPNVSEPKPSSETMDTPYQQITPEQLKYFEQMGKPASDLT
jgi:hypothetical protein